MRIRSVNEVICHGIPDDRPIADGDIVNLDVTVFHKGHHSDLNETYLVGAVDDESKVRTATFVFSQYSWNEYMRKGLGQP